MPSNRPLSPFNLFQRYKRSKILEARAKSGDESAEAVRRVVLSVPGLEDYSPEAVDALSPQDLGDLRRIKIRAVLDQNSRAVDAADGWDFAELNKMMSAAWQAIDEFGEAVFEELAEEGRSATPSPVVTTSITPQIRDGAASPTPKASSPGPGSFGPELEDSGLCLVQEVTFPRQLMDIIEHQSTKGGVFTAAGERVLEWLPAGDAFVIRDKALLEQEVLPKHFSAKSKFMSFIRKLYRWGFRQLEKDSRGTLIFSHFNFRRGDKKRCLKMRSVVKKSPTQAQKRALKLKAPPTASPGFSTKANLQAFGGGSPNKVTPTGVNQYFGMGGPRAMGGYAPIPPPPLAMDQFTPAPRPMHPSIDRCGSMMNPMDAMGYGVLPSPFPSGTSGHYPPNSTRGATKMTSAKMFEAALRMERQERHEEMQRKMQMMDALRGDSCAPPLYQRPSVGSEVGRGGTSSVGMMSDVERAYEMMKRHSRMEALQALEFAKRTY